MALVGKNDLFLLRVGHLKLLDELTVLCWDHLTPEESVDAHVQNLSQSYCHILSWTIKTVLLAHLCFSSQCVFYVSFTLVMFFLLFYCVCLYINIYITLFSTVLLKLWYIFHSGTPPHTHVVFMTALNKTFLFYSNRILILILNMFPFSLPSSLRAANVNVSF